MGKKSECGRRCGPHYTSLLTHTIPQEPMGPVHDHNSVYSRLQEQTDARWTWTTRRLHKKTAAGRQALQGPRWTRLRARGSVRTRSGVSNPHEHTLVRVGAPPSPLIAGEKRRLVSITTTSPVRCVRRRGGGRGVRPRQHSRRRRSGGEKHSEPWLWRCCRVRLPDAPRRSNVSLGR